MKTVAAALAGAAALIGGGVALTGAMQSPPAAAQQRLVWLEQNWTPEQRKEYHHMSQGTATIPVPMPGSWRWSSRRGAAC